MPRSFALTVVTLGALSAFTPLAVDMYLPALPSLARDFAADAGRVQLTLSVFMAGMAGGQLLYGPVSDRFGRKRPLLGGALLFVLASLGCALAPSLDALIGLRLLQALGGCAGVVIARAGSSAHLLRSGSFADIGAFCEATKLRLHLRARHAGRAGADHRGGAGRDGPGQRRAVRLALREREDERGQETVPRADRAAERHRHGRHVHDARFAGQHRALGPQAHRDHPRRT